MKKLHLKRAVKIAALVLAVLLAVLLLQEFVYRDDWENAQGDFRVKGFYREPRDTLDVVLIGDSTIYAGYAPALAYETEGFTSYHYAIGANVCTTWRPITEDILRTQDPQLIVVDVGGVQYDSLQEKYDASSTIHVMLDNMPLSGNKLRTIRAVVDRYGDRAAEYYLPFIRYHGEWSGFGQLAARAREMFSWKYVSRNILKGTAARVTWEPSRSDRMDVRDDHSTQELTPESEEVLRDYLAYCRDNGVNVVFISAPCRINPDDESRPVFLRENRAGQIVEEYGFDFVNFHYLTDEIGLDMERDFYNDAHLNYRGQLKFTEYLARFLAEEYGVRGGGLTESQQAVWERSAAYYHRFFDYAEELSASGEDVLLSECIEIMDALDALE